MEQKICLDTDFMINFLRNKEVELSFVQEVEGSSTLAITLVTLFELFYGAYRSDESKKNLAAIHNLLNRLELLPLSIDSTQKAGEIAAQLRKKGKPIDFRDLLIGTIALSEGYAIKTHNAKHFVRIPGLDVV